MSAELDPLQVLDEFEPIRETCRGLVAAFVADGFTVEQARALVIHIVTTKHEA